MNESASEPGIRIKTSELLNLEYIDGSDESLVCDPESGTCFALPPSQEQLATTRDDVVRGFKDSDEMTTNDFPMDPTRWRTGLTLSEFITEMSHNQVAMRRRLTEVKLAPDDRHYFNQISQTIHVSVVTEDWCGDSLMNLPILARIVEAAPQMDLRIFVRSETAELTDHFAELGITQIPIVTFLDLNFKEIGTWVERSQAAHGRLEEWIAGHPDVMEALSDPGLSMEEQHRLFEEQFSDFMVDMEVWYTEELQQATVDEIKALPDTAIMQQLIKN